MMRKTSMQLLLRTMPVFLLLAMVSCNKDDNGGDPETPPVSDTIYGKLITVSNLAPEVTDDNDPTSTNRPPMYFSLEESKAVPAAYVKTARWDISFTEIYNSFLGGNNGGNTANLGSGGPGKGGIYMVEEPFENVLTAPDDTKFHTGKGVYGTDDSGDFGAGFGWYLYDFGGTIKGDGSYDLQHVVYPIQPRTIIVRTARGNYAKIKMLSLYKDELDPTKWRRNTPHPYFSFQYVLMKNGNKNFEIK